MLKLRRGRQQSSESAPGAPVANDAPKSTGRKSLLVLAFIVVLLVIGGSVWWFFIRAQDSGPQVIRTNSEQQYANKLKNNKPAADTSAAEKATYYRQMASAQADLKDYTAAAQAYEELEALSSKAMTYRDYYYQGYYYQLAGNKSAALAALDKAEKSLPAKDAPEDGYFKQDFLGRINTIRKDAEQ